MHWAKCFGLSLALHLAAATGLIVMAPRHLESTPETIMVVFEDLAAPDLPQHKVARIPDRAVVRPVSPATPAKSKPEAVKSEQLQQAVQPVMPRGTVPNQPIEQSQVSEVPNVSPKHTTGVSSQPSPDSSAPQPVQQAAAAAEGRPTLEQTQQRYVKEHFTYIRELITKHLVYPPIARRMNWSGKAIVAFTIAEDGTVHAVRVVEKSGFPILDKCALETVRNAAPFPKPPVRAEIVVPINFMMMR